MNDENIVEWKSGEIFQDDEYASLYAKHRKYMVTKILENTCFLMKRPIVGIVKAKVYYNNGNVNEFLDECYRFSKEKNIPHIEIYTSIADRAFSQFPYESTGTYVIDLNEDIETLWGKLTHSTRKKIRQAENRNVKIEISDIENDFLDWWDIYMKTVNRKKFISESFPFPKELFKNKKLSRLFVAKIDDKIVSGWLILLFENGIISKLSASNREYLRSHSGDLLVWKLIEWAKKQGYSYYDMGGALPPRYDKNNILINEGHGEGPSAFKKKFGGNYSDIYKYQIITNKTKYRIIKALIDVRFKLIKHL